MVKWDRGEAVRLHKALSAFFHAQWERLMEKAAEGFSGWDDPDDVPDGALLKRLRAKAEIALRPGEEGRALAHLVDIANFALFLWWRERQRDREDSLGRGASQWM